MIIDTSNLYGMDDLIDGTYVQIKESWVKSLLSVPEDLDTEFILGEASYWLAAVMYVIYYEIMKDNDCIAAAGVNALTGELAKDIRIYSN